MTKSQKNVPTNNHTTSNTSAISNTSSTGTTSNLYNFALVLSTLQETFSGTLRDLILEYFLTTKNEPISIAKLAENIGEKKGSVRSAINYHNSIFVTTSTQGKEGLVQVSTSWMDQILSEKERKEQKKKELEKIRIEEKNIQESLKEDILTFLRKSKPKREGGFLFLDFRELAEYDPKLADIFLEDPKTILEFISEKYDGELEIQVLNLPSSVVINIEEIRKEHLEKVICVEGRVTSFGEVKPVIMEITFECPSCGTVLKADQNYRVGTINEPSRCSCGRRGAFKVVDRKEVDACFLQFEDLQDKTDNPHSQRIKAVLFNKLTSSENIRMFTPGNEVKCVGVLKEVPIYKNNKKTIFLNWILEIMSAELIDKDVVIEKLSSTDVEEINILASKINQEGIEALLPSFCPEVYGYNHIKSAIILQLCNKRNDKKKKAVRNKSNILLIGDPGVAKSVLCDFATEVSSGARKAVGGGSSAVGITASVMKEEDALGGYRVEPGAMILAKDLLFLDELNNLADEDKPKLQEGMSEQVVSINKANIHVQMKVTAGILAVANPRNGHFIESSKESIQEQFNLPSPILNRFDSVFVVRDYVNEETDSKIAKKMIQRHRGIIKPEYDKTFLKKFFAYVQYQEDPIIDEKMQDFLRETYMRVRKTVNTGVKINPRFLESLTRMGIAFAKLRKDDKVKEKDINLALDILSESQYKIENIKK